MHLELVPSFVPRTITAPSRTGCRGQKQSSRYILNLCTAGWLIWLACGAAVAGPALAQAPANRASHLTLIAPGVYKFSDTCNVYVIVKGDQALLIDFGSGQVLSILPAIGVRKVDWILHTHFHRDNTQGDELATRLGIKIAVPASETRYFDGVEEFWNTKRVFDLYDMRDEFMARRCNIAVGQKLKPETTFTWNGLNLQVIGTPGHSEGSLSFKLVTGGKTLLFCGDVVASAGKIPTMYDLEWDYVGTRGILAEMGSINRIRDIDPDLLLPSHGSPSEDVERWTPDLLAEIAKIYHEYDWINFSQRRPEPGPVKLSPHVWQMRRAFAYGVGYLIVGNTGHAMLWDINAGEVSFLEQMRKIAGFKSLDVIVPSHYHDDHVGGINAVKKQYGAQLWAMEHLVDVLQHPEAYLLPCLWHEGAKVDRVLHDGEKVDFDGIPMQFFYLPGQTEYTEGLLLTDGGKRILFDGDNVAHPLPGTPLQGHFVCRNYQHIGGGHVYSARKILELMPDYIAPNHFEWNVATPELMESYLKTSEEVQNAWKQIIDQPAPELGVDASWASFYPYQVEAGPGSEIASELRIRNWIHRDSHIRAIIQAPESWTVVPRILDLDVAADAAQTGKFLVKIPATESRLNRRFVLTADIWRDGQHLGEITEALVNMKPMRAH